MFFHDVFADGNGGFLQLGDVQKDLPVWRLVPHHGPGNVGDLVGDAFDQVGIVIDADIQNREKDVVAVNGLDAAQAAAGLGKGMQIPVSLGEQNFVLQNEGNRVNGEIAILGVPESSC